MKKNIFYAAMGLFVSCSLFFACSKSKEADKGFVEKTNEEMSKRAVDYVKKPLGRAKSISELSKNRAGGLAEPQDAAGE
ncbi:MAG: hypothetical protein WCQ99_09705 [Pseudomonadota bacterium]